MASGNRPQDHQLKPTQESNKHDRKQNQPRELKHKKKGLRKYNKWAESGVLGRHDRGYEVESSSPSLNSQSSSPLTVDEAVKIVKKEIPEKKYAVRAYCLVEMLRQLGYKANMKISTDKLGLYPFRNGYLLSEPPKHKEIEDMDERVFTGNARYFSLSHEWDNAFKHISSSPIAYSTISWLNSYEILFWNKPSDLPLYAKHLREATQKEVPQFLSYAIRLQELAPKYTQRDEIEEVIKEFKEKLSSSPINKDMAFINNLLDIMEDKNRFKQIQNANNRPWIRDICEELSFISRRNKWAGNDINDVIYFLSCGLWQVNDLTWAMDVIMQLLKSIRLKLEDDNGQTFKLEE